MAQRVTVAICTWNRSRSLRATLASVGALHVPAGVDWEVLVVLNNCTDDTESVAAEHARALPLRILRERRQGLSHARNCAVAAAQGDHILWTDDDVVVDRLWLAAYVEAFREFGAAAVFGGPIEVELEGSPPEWVRALARDEDLSGVYARRDLGPRGIELAPARGLLPFGANFAVRTCEQRVFRYDPRFGRAGASLVGGEETRVLAQILAMGRTGRWVPGARVVHRIPPRLQTRSHVRRFFVAYGRATVREQGVDVRRAPRRLWRVVRSSPAVVGIRRARGDRAALMALRDASIAWGRFLETIGWKE